MHPQSFLRNFWMLEVKSQIFVAMSFADHYKNRFDNIIKPAIESIRVDGVHQTAHRVDLSKTGDSILTDIMDGISHSRMVLADVSTFGHDSKTGNPYRNGNVMYEVGIALASRQPEEVLLIRDDKDKFLFDISTIPQMHIDFGDADKAITTLREELVSRLKAIQYFKDARVQRAIASLTAAELRMLKEMADDPPHRLRVVPHPQPNTVSIGNFSDSEAIPRLVDKQLVVFAGEAVGGVSGYGFQLTFLGRTVAQNVKNRFPTMSVEKS